MSRVVRPRRRKPRSRPDICPSAVPRSRPAAEGSSGRAQRDPGLAGSEPTAASFAP